MRRLRKLSLTVARLVVLACPLAHDIPGLAAPRPTGFPEPPPGAMARLSAGEPQDLIVLFDSDAVDAEAWNMRLRSGLEHEDDAILAFKSARYGELKRSVLAAVSGGEMEEVGDYSHLPMAFLRVRSAAALRRLQKNAGVKAIYEDFPLYLSLAESLPLIGQPTVAAAGKTGAGVAVAVLDTGINYTLPAFGSCTSPGVPAECRVSASVDVTGHGVTLNTDPYDHGTNVSGIVAGVAPGAQIASVNVFSGGTSYATWVVAGINWAIANRSTYGIVAINMSLGDGAKHAAPCADADTNPFLTPLANARAAGILPVASSGNEAYLDGIASPACTPGVVSVGAVYDANLGGLQWSTGCIDYTTAPDKITCFSNSASFLTMLAPGALVTAAGITMGGTSQASPHVAGSVAVLRAAFPAEALDQTAARMTSSGAPITDPRNGIAKPRLNLLGAVESGASDGDIPALPPWAVAAMVLALLRAAGVTRRTRSRPSKDQCGRRPGPL